MLEPFSFDCLESSLLKTRCYATPSEPRMNERINVFLPLLLFSSLLPSRSSSGASVVAIDNKIEQAMVSLHRCFSRLRSLFCFTAREHHLYITCDDTKTSDRFNNGVTLHLTRLYRRLLCIIIGLLCMIMSYMDVDCNVMTCICSFLWRRVGNSFLELLVFVVMFPTVFILCVCVCVEPVVVARQTLTPMPWITELLLPLDEEHSVPLSDWMQRLYTGRIPDLRVKL